MSEVSQGPGWWQASDGKWYSPDQVPAGSDGSASYGSDGPASYGMPGGGGYGLPGIPYGYGGVPSNNGLAIASLVCSFFFWIYGLGAVLAIVFGFIARVQIKRSNGMQKGAGMALAGIIIGFAGIVIGIGVAIAVVMVVHRCNGSGSCTFITGN